MSHHWSSCFYINVPNLSHPLNKGFPTYQMKGHSFYSWSCILLYCTFFLMITTLILSNTPLPSSISSPSSKWAWNSAGGMAGGVPPNLELWYQMSHIQLRNLDIVPRWLSHCDQTVHWNLSHHYSSKRCVHSSPHWLKEEDMEQFFVWNTWFNYVCFLPLSYCCNSHRLACTC